MHKSVYQEALMRFDLYVSFIAHHSFYKSHRSKFDNYKPGVHKFRAPDRLSKFWRVIFVGPQYGT